MDIFQAIILGIVQGITEWLPISSSGHLVIFQQLLGLEQPVVFDLALHIGSLLVVFFVFWKDIVALVTGVFNGKKDKLLMLLYLFIATIPIALVGYFFKDYVESAFNSLKVVGFGLLFTATLLFFSKYPVVKKKVMNWRDSVVVGIFQAIAILPGVSRSGSTISSGMMLGIKREDAARFSFLLFIPAILGATVLELGNISAVSDVGLMIVGVLFSIIAGLLSLRILLNLIRNGKFHYFGYYCLLLGLLVLLYVYL